MVHSPRFTVHGIKNYKLKTKKLFSRYSLLIPVILFALTFAGCIPSGILKTNPVKIASRMEQKNADEAIHILENALKKGKLNKKMKIDVLLKLSSLYEKKENYSDSTKALKEVLKIKPEDNFVHFRLGEVYLKLELYENALKEFRYLYEKGASSPAILRNLGEIYLRRGQFTKANRFFTEYQKFYPDDRNIKYKLFKINEALGNYSQARSFLGQCSGILEENDFILKLAMNWMRSGNPIEAIEELEKHKEKTPDFLFFLGLAYYQKGDIEKAQEYFKRTEGKYKDFSRFFYALVKWQVGEKERAREIFKDLKSKNIFTKYCEIFIR